jgi:hypothetical protein
MGGECTASSRSHRSSGFLSRVKTLRRRGRRYPVESSLQPRCVVDGLVRAPEEDEDGRSLSLPPRCRQTSRGATSSTRDPSSKGMNHKGGGIVVGKIDADESRHAPPLNANETPGCAMRLTRDPSSNGDESRRWRAGRWCRSGVDPDEPAGSWVVPDEIHGGLVLDGVGKEGGKWNGVPCGDVKRKGGSLERLPHIDVRCHCLRSARAI